MKQLFASLIILSSLGLFGQTFAPMGAKWTFGIYEFWWGQYPSIWTVSSEITLNGKTYSVIARGPKGGVGDFDSELRTFQDSGVVYFYNSINFNYTTFIDFNAKAGDSWTTSYPFYCDVTTYVDSTDTININSHNLKRMYVHLTNSIGARYIIIEHIGYVNGYGKPYGNDGTGLYPGQFIDKHCTGNWSADGPEYTGLRCYEDSIIGFVDFEPNVECEFEFRVGMKENHAKNGITVFPNPADRYLIIKFKNNDLADYQYNIVNNQGIELTSGMLSDELKIDVSSLASGIYFLKLFNDQKSHSTLFVKK